MATFVKSGKQLTIFLKGRSYSVNESHPNYVKIKANLDNDDVLMTLIDVTKTVREYVATEAGGRVTVSGGQVMFDGESVHNVISDRILELVREKMPFKGMVLFLENLMQNPSNAAVEELYEFLENKALPIDSDNGCFIAYKAVQEDYYSKTAGKLKLLQGHANEQGYIYNGLGETVECVRNQVDDKRENHCSRGLHAGCIPYVESFGNGSTDKVVVVLINPRDVVSVPNDSSCQKVRVCKYKVLCDYIGPLNQPMYEIDEVETEVVYGDENPVLSNVVSTKKYSLKPSGQKYHDVRDSSGKFKKNAS